MVGSRLKRCSTTIKSRGNQTIFRVNLEYPGHSNVIPEFLLIDGLRVTRWRNEEEATDAEIGWKRLITGIQR